MYYACHLNLVILFNWVLQKMPSWMDDMCQKSMNMLWVIAHDQKQPILTHVVNVAKSQPSLTRLAKS
jgi:hypothetical protein